MLLCTFVLLGSALWLAAQEGDPGADRVQGSNAPTIRGCLESSAGNYYITEKDGTQTQLAGGSHLSDYVGHEIEVDGKPTIITIDTTSDGAASTVEELTIFHVRTVKDLAPKCTSATS